MTRGTRRFVLVSSIVLATGLFVGAAAYFGVWRAPRTAVGGARARATTFSIGLIVRP